MAVGTTFHALLSDSEFFSCDDKYLRDFFNKGGLDISRGMAVTLILKIKGNKTVSHVHGLDILLSLCEL